MTTSVKVGDYGTLINVDTGADLSTVTVQKIFYKKPDGTIGEWVASISENRYLQYVTLEDDIDIPGIWKIQAYIETPAGVWYGDMAKFSVGSGYVLSA